MDNKRYTIEKADSGILIFNDEIWNFIISNQVEEVLPFALKMLGDPIYHPQNYPDAYKEFYRQLLTFIDALPNGNKTAILYDTIDNATNKQMASVYCNIVKELHLLDLDKVELLLKQDNFDKQKLGLRLVINDQAFYNKTDIAKLIKIKDEIQNLFNERGKKTTKKQMLSSKEKEVWICECGKTNDIEYVNCQSCDKDIYGFTTNEVTPSKAILNIENKISLIKDFIIE